MKSNITLSLELIDMEEVQGQFDDVVVVEEGCAAVAETPPKEESIEPQWRQPKERSSDESESDSGQDDYSADDDDDSPDDYWEEGDDGRVVRAGHNPNRQNTAGAKGGGNVTKFQPPDKVFKKFSGKINLEKYEGPRLEGSAINTVLEQNRRADKER